MAVVAVLAADGDQVLCGLDAVPLAQLRERSARTAFTPRTTSTGATAIPVSCSSPAARDVAQRKAAAQLARRGDGTPALLLLTFRDYEVGSDHPLRVLLGELATVQRVCRIAMRALSRAAVQELARGSRVDLLTDEQFAAPSGL